MKHRVINKILALILILFFSIDPAKSLALDIKGYILNLEGNPINDAIISLSSLDSIVKQQTNTNIDGVFQLSSIDKQNIIKVTKTGYETYFRRIETSDSILYITLHPHGTDLDEFTVTARRPNMKVESGRFIFEPGELVNLVSNASRILDYVPILKKGDEGYNIISKQADCAQIFINGEEPIISQGSIMDWLKQLPASSIIKVEIISTPDATNSTDIINRGIINIVVKDKVTGYFGNLSMGSTLRNKGKLYLLNPGANFYFQNDEFLFNLKGDYQHSNAKGEKLQDFEDLEKNIIRHITTNSNSKNRVLRLNAVAQYKFGKNSISVTFTDRAIYWKALTKTDQTEKFGSNIISISNTHDQLTPMYHSMLTGVRYQYLINKERNSKLTAKYYTVFGKPLHVTDKLYDSLHESPIVDQSQRFNSATHGLILGYENTLSNNSTLNIKTELSYKWDYTDFQDDSDKYKLERKQLTSKISASFSTKWSNIFSTNISAVEYLIKRKLSIEPENEIYSNFFSVFCPNINLSFSFKGGLHNLNLNWYGYPYFVGLSELNPHKIWSSSTSYYVGNAETAPGYAHSVSADYSFLGDYYISLRYDHSNMPGQSFLTSDKDGNTVTNALGVMRQRNLNLTLNYRKNLFNYRWTIGATLTGQWRNVMTDQGKDFVGIHKLSYNINLSSDVVISRRYDINASVNYMYFAPGLEQFNRRTERHDLNLSIQKTFGNNADINGYISIPLNRTSETFETPAIINKYYNPYQKCISIGLNITVTLGNRKIEKAEF